MHNRSALPLSIVTTCTHAGIWAQAAAAVAAAAVWANDRGAIAIKIGSTCGCLLAYQPAYTNARVSPVQCTD